MISCLISLAILQIQPLPPATTLFFNGPNPQDSTGWGGIIRLRFEPSPQYRNIVPWPVDGSFERFSVRNRPKSRMLLLDNGHKFFEVDGALPGTPRLLFDLKEKVQQGQIPAFFTHDYAVTRDGSHLILLFYHNPDSKRSIGRISLATGQYELLVSQSEVTAALGPEFDYEAVGYSYPGEFCVSPDGSTVYFDGPTAEVVNENLDDVRLRTIAFNLTTKTATTVGIGNPLGVLSNGNVFTHDMVRGGPYNLLEPRFRVYSPTGTLLGFKDGYDSAAVDGNHIALVRGGTAEENAQDQYVVEIWNADLSQKVRTYAPVRAALGGGFQIRINL